jgi:phosphoribosylanthranilate isomerase
MTQVKVCGINDPIAFDTAVEAGADWVGFVFFPPSPRYVTPRTAATLSGRISGGPPRVGLFVDPTETAIAQVLEIMKLDILQLYGTSADLAAIKARFGLPIWRSIGISGAADLPSDRREADRLLLEAKPPGEADRPGGNAKTFDWSVLRGWAAPAPWVLAGGLTPQNVARAITETGAAAVDVSSGVESRTGAKDAGLIRAFIAAAKGAATSSQTQ